MLFKPGFDDRRLAESFYQTLLQRLCDSFDNSTQRLLEDCNFGFAPSPLGLKTFFIVAPNLEVAEQLIERIETIIGQVTEIMAGVGQTAICVGPKHEPVDCSDSTEQSDQNTPRFMMGKIFPHPPVEDEMLD